MIARGWCVIARFGSSDHNDLLSLSDLFDTQWFSQVEVLKLACRAAGLNKDALQEALKDAAVRAQMEVLKKRETELEAEVMDE
jgi:hypothetical protein